MALLVLHIRAKIEVIRRLSHSEFSPLCQELNISMEMLGPNFHTSDLGLGMRYFLVLTAL